MVPIEAVVTCLLPAVLALAAAAPELQIFGDGLRLDLDTGRAIEGAEETRRDARFVAVRDEVLSFQLVVRGEPGARALRLEALIDPDSRASPIRLHAFEERPIRVTEPSESELVFPLGPGSYPDVLMPAVRTVVGGSSGVAVLWFDIFVPRGTAAGVHRGGVSIGDATPLPIEIEVLDLELPRRDVTGLGAMNFGSILEREGREPGALLEWVQLARAHGLSPEVLRMVPPIVDGEIQWSKWGERVEPFVSGRAFSEELGYEGPWSGVPLASFVIPHTDWWPVGPKGDGTPSDEDAWARSLGAWERFVVERGWHTMEPRPRWTLFVNALDEPKSEAKLLATKRYEALIASAKLRDRSAVSFRVDGCFGQPIAGWDAERMAQELGGVVDLWNVHGAVYTMPMAVLDERRTKHGEGVLFYVSNTSGEPAVPPLVVDSAIAGARALGWIVWRYGLVGAMNWELDGGSGCVASPRCSEGGRLNLDATLIYRGRELGLERDEPIPSMRLKMLRRGAQDAALLELLAARDPDGAKGLAHSIVPRALGDGLEDGERGRWPRLSSGFERTRLELLARLSGRGGTIAKLGPADEKNPGTRGDARDGRVSPWIAVGIVVLVLAGLLARRIAFRARGRG